MCDPVSMTVVAAAASTALQINQGEQARRASNTAADKAAAAADQAYNKANGKQPNVAALAADNRASATAGVGGTMLTGPQGIDPSFLLLGKQTLLGG